MNKELEALLKKMLWFLGIIIVCIVGIILLTDMEKKSAVIDYEDQPFLGEESAPVDIVEFGDYKCPACKDFDESLYPLIDQEFVKKGKVKFYFMNYSFINIDSHRSAQFAETVYQELGNEKFWSFHHLLFKKQPDDLSYEKVDLYTDTFLKETLSEVANVEETDKVMKAFAENQGKVAWEKDMAIAKSLNVASTPSLYINGKQFKGKTLDDLKEMVEKATVSGE